VKYLWYNVPEYIFGEPLYDNGDCISYLVKKLEDNGFEVKYIHPNNLYISWMKFIPSYVRDKFRKDTGKRINERGEIIEQQSIMKLKRKKTRNNNYYMVEYPRKV
jgi:hypothetical protein